MKKTLCPYCNKGYEGHTIEKVGADGVVWVCPPITTGDTTSPT